MSTSTVPSAGKSSSAAFQRPKILMLGDSLTQTSLEGWGGGLAHQYQRRADVLNRGMSGYNTRWYLEYTGQSAIWEEPGKVALVTIFFGANDASLAEHNPHHHVPVEEYKESLKKLVSKSKESFPDAKILLITPPPVHHEQRYAYQKERYADKATGVLERTLESAENYAQACKAVATSEEVPVLDLFQAMTKDGTDFGPFFYDGLHFSKDGHDFVLKELLAAIERYFPSLAVKPDPITKQPNNSSSQCLDISSSGPYHDQIDHLRYRDAFSSKNGTKADDEPDAKRAKTT